MKESHIGAIATVMFIIIGALFFTCTDNMLAQDFGICMGFCSFFCLCIAADNAAKGN